MVGQIRLLDLYRNQFDTGLRVRLDPSDLVQQGGGLAALKWLVDRAGGLRRW